MTIISSWDIRRNGRLFPAGEVVELSAEEEQQLVDEGKAHFVTVVNESTNIGGKSEMSVKELEEFLQTAEYIEDVEELLQKELSRKDPRKTAVKLLEDWLKEADENADSQGSNPQGQSDGIPES